MGLDKDAFVDGGGALVVYVDDFGTLEHHGNDHIAELQRKSHEEKPIYC